eukprot:GHVO01014973.1.p1 GENE.GHVO01014973.1~~GHVO01014973.1.p1  ORF type:complete len:490 (+),score=58.32 GHVO01014973.1:206-1471(+)
MGAPSKFKCSQEVLLAPCVIECPDMGVASGIFNRLCREKRITDTCEKAAIEGHLNGSDSNTLQTYFNYYSKLSNQANMLQDHIRTEAYKRAVIGNPMDFAGKTVMDVGAGSGILSFFAAQAKAKKIYAVEASNISDVIEILRKGNLPQLEAIQIVASTVEGISDDTIPPNSVDTIISEPIGTFLFNERMIESYLYARDRYLKKGGKMYPNRCRLSVAPFTDAALYNDMNNRGTFWTAQDFHGLDLTAASVKATEEQFRQPIVDYIDPHIIVSSPHNVDYDMETVDRHDLENMSIDFEFNINTPSLVHGIAGWFDIFFEGSNESFGFSTAPWCAPTHWYQIRFLFTRPLALNANQILVGNLKMIANSQQSYTIKINANIKGTDISTETVLIDLKDPDYRYYTNPTVSYYPPNQAAGAPTTTS